MSYLLETSVFLLKIEFIHFKKKIKELVTFKKIGLLLKKRSRM